jgi:hypothetical protein
MERQCELLRGSRFTRCEPALERLHRLRLQVPGVARKEKVMWNVQQPKDEEKTMKKRWSIVVGSVACMAFLALGATSKAADAPETWTVGSGKQFTKIQDAVDAAKANDVIKVWPGYYKGATVDKKLSIRGVLVSDGNKNTWDGPTVNRGDELTEGSGLQLGFQLVGRGTAGTKIVNFRFAKVAFPIYAKRVNEVSVLNNLMQNPVQGITNWMGSDWTITGNTIDDVHGANGGGYGIFLGLKGAEPALENCTISGNDIKGIGLAGDCSDCSLSSIGLYAESGVTNAIQNNTITGNKIRLLRSDNESPVVFGIALYQAAQLSKCRIGENNLSNNTFAIPTDYRVASSPTDLLERCNNTIESGSVASSTMIEPMSNLMMKPY